MSDQFEPRVVKGLRKKPVIVEPSTPSAATGAPPAQIPTEVEPTEDEAATLLDYFAAQAEIQTKINAVGDLVKRRHGIPANHGLHFDAKTRKLQVKPPAAS